MSAEGVQADPASVSLELATAADQALLANLLELYVHDLSAAFPNVELGADGRFGYPALPLYFSEPERRFAFLIRQGERVAGFVLVTRGSPALADPDVLDVAEFFVLRRYRRAQIGRRAALLLWSRLPGTWVVRVSERNPSALEFWGRVIAEYAPHTRIEWQHPGRSGAWQVFCFETRGVQAARSSLDPRMPGG
jgi:predicted acetyltransferase